MILCSARFGPFCIILFTQSSKRGVLWTGWPIKVVSYSAEKGLDRLPGLFEGGRLSPTQRRVARYVADHPREAPFLSSVELAARAGVSQPTVTRLAVALGYGGYGEFQRDLRRVVLGTPEEAGGNKFQVAVDQEISNLRALRDNLEDDGAIADLGRELAASEPLVVVGLRASAPLAGFFSYFAEKLHPDVRSITGGGTAGTDRLAQARRAGARWVLCYVLPRYPRETLGMMGYAGDLGMRVAAVSDRAGGAVSELAEVVLPAGVGTRLVFDSQTAAMALSAALIEALSDAAPERAQANLEAFEHRAQNLGWFAE
jgi:DNA-binding MurR/RpiR family transcriptional regulator